MGTSTRSVAPATSACPMTTALSCTTVPRLSAVAASPSCPRIWTTSPSLAAPTTAPPTLPTPTSPLSTRCTGVTSTPRRRPAPRSPAPADIPPLPATLSAVKHLNLQQHLQHQLQQHLQFSPRFSQKTENSGDSRLRYYDVACLVLSTLVKAFTMVLTHEFDMK